MKFWGMVLAFLVGLSSSLTAKNIDLVTLPSRNSVQLTIYNSEDITLVKEVRHVTLKEGINRLQFSWAGTLIDPTSVVVRALEHADELDVLDTVYPGQKPQHLIWNIQSDVEGEVPLEVSYFTSGLTWQMDYVSIVDPAGETQDFRGFVRVFNNSGEEYENADVRLIVGKINLVEKIAQLAQHRSLELSNLSDLQTKSLRRESVSMAFREADAKGLSSRLGDRREIVKEGLSEYFMFSVQGTMTIRNGWSKRMESVEATDVKFDTVYRLRAYQYGLRPVKFVIWTNDEAHQLGDSPLPDGQVRLFRRNDQDGLSFLGQQRINYVPIQAKIEINLGVDDLVTYERRNIHTTRSDFAFHPVHKHVTGWHESQRWFDTVANYHDKPIQVELRLQFAGDVEFRSTQKTTSFDYNTVETKFTVPAGDATTYRYKLLYRHGTSSKQNRVLLK